MQIPEPPGRPDCHHRPPGQGNGGGPSGGRGPKRLLSGKSAGTGGRFLHPGAAGLSSGCERGQPPTSLPPSAGTGPPTATHRLPAVARETGETPGLEASTQPDQKVSLEALGLLTRNIQGRTGTPCFSQARGSALERARYPPRHVRVCLSPTVVNKDAECYYWGKGIWGGGFAPLLPSSVRVSRLLCRGRGFDPAASGSHLPGAAGTGLRPPESGPQPPLCWPARVLLQPD